MNSEFDYNTAFSRNIGWITETEQALLKSKRVAIAGLGGVGGAHLITLCRLGIEQFTLSDFDCFGVENFNRQAGARMETVGRPKLDAVIEMAQQINPNVQIRRYKEGITTENLEAFLHDADIYVDGLDFFALDIREAVFAYCHENQIPAVTAAPLGMGTAVISFTPGSMSFADYFGLQGSEGAEKYLRFFIGLSPARLAQPYLVDPRHTDLEAKKGPSSIIGCELCAGTAAAQVLKILTQRGKVYAAPYSLHFDAFRNKFKKCYRLGGAKNPIQQLSLVIGRRFLAQQKRHSKPLETEEIPNSIAEQVIDYAKWAPSGDNTQPWRFEIHNDTTFSIHGYDTRDWVVYDLEGHASQLALGALIESVSLAALLHKHQADIQEEEHSTELKPLFRITLSPVETESVDPVDVSIASHLKVRSVQRRCMPIRKVTEDTWNYLTEVLPEGYQLKRFENFKSRWTMAKLMFMNAKVRLTMQEAYQVHRQIIEWNAQFSTDRIPDKALGTNKLVLKLMPWLMAKWERLQFCNRFLAGTIMPRLELDLLPGIFCSGHVVLTAPKPATSTQDYIRAGRAMQRFWLACSVKGLSIQPEMTPLIFNEYLQNGIEFTANKQAKALSESCSRRLQQILGEETTHQAFFACRMGYGPLPASRSTRKTLMSLQHFAKTATE